MAIPDPPAKYESASVRLTLLPNGTLTVTHLFSMQERKGHATELMKLVCDYADKYAKVAILRAGQYGKTTGMNDEQLIRFYEKFGFKLLKGSGPGNWVMKRETKGN